MDRGTAHVALVSTLTGPLTRPVQHAPVVPDDQITRLQPGHADGILGLGRVLVQPRHQLRRPLGRHAVAFQVVQMGADVQVQPPARLAPLHDLVRGSWASAAGQHP